MRTRVAGSFTKWAEHSSDTPSHLCGLKRWNPLLLRLPKDNDTRGRSLLSQPRLHQRVCIQPSSLAIAQISRALSQAPIEVPPMQITTPAGVIPASLSCLIAARKSSDFIAKLSSVGILTRLFCPKPAIQKRFIDRTMRSARGVNAKRRLTKTALPHCLSN